MAKIDWDDESAIIVDDSALFDTLDDVTNGFELFTIKKDCFHTVLSKRNIL